MICRKSSLSCESSAHGLRAQACLRSVSSLIRPAVAAVAIAGLGLPLSSAQAQVTETNQANNLEGGDDTSNNGPTISFTGGRGEQWEIFKVPEDSPRRNNTDPRAEKAYSPASGNGIIHGHPNGSSAELRFRADYRIFDANNTTICQLLNSDPSSDDSARPYVEIMANRKVGSRWEIRVNPRGSGREPFTGRRKDCLIDDTRFSLEMITNNRRCRVIIRQNRQTMLDYSFSFVGEEVDGRRGVSRIRFGAYHHGFRNGDAHIEVRNATVTGIPNVTTHLRNIGRNRWLRIDSRNRVRTASGMSGSDRDFRLRFDTRGSTYRLDSLKSGVGILRVDDNDNVVVGSNSGNDDRRFSAIREGTRYRFRNRETGEYLAATSSGDGVEMITSKNNRSLWEIRN